MSKTIVQSVQAVYILECLEKKLLVQGWACALFIASQFSPVSVSVDLQTDLALYILIVNTVE